MRCMGSVSYLLPFGRSSRWGGWSLSGVNSFHTGLPLNVTITRKATAVPDGNTEQPASGLRVGRVADSGGWPESSTTGSTLLHSRRRPTAHGEMPGRDIVTGPNLFQIDAALQKDTRLSERMGLIFRADVFNVFNHPELGSPNLNISSPATFGRITSLENTCRSAPAALGVFSWRFD